MFKANQQLFISVPTTSTTNPYMSNDTLIQIQFAIGLAVVPMLLGFIIWSLKWLLNLNFVTKDNNSRLSTLEQGMGSHRTVTEDNLKNINSQMTQTQIQVVETQADLKILLIKIEAFASKNADTAELVISELNRVKSEMSAFRDSHNTALQVIGGEFRSVKQGINTLQSANRDIFEEL